MICAFRVLTFPWFASICFSVPHDIAGFCGCPIVGLACAPIVETRFSNLPCLYSIFHLEYPLVLSRFLLLATINMTRTNVRPAQSYVKLGSLMITDDGSVPEMRIWSILLIQSDFKWCIHLSRNLLLYFTFLIGNIYVQFEAMVYQQIVGIQMRKTVHHL